MVGNNKIGSVGNTGSEGGESGAFNVAVGSSERHLKGNGCIGAEDNLAVGAANGPAFAGRAANLASTGVF